MLSTDTRFFGGKVVERSGILYTFLCAAFFVALLVVIQKVLTLNHKDVGMRCNRGPNVWSLNLIYDQPIFLQNNVVCRDP